VTVDTALDVVFLAVGLAIGLSVHEFAHAWTANRFGDLTPRLAGRMTLNPRPHVDAFGTLILPSILLLVVLFSVGGGSPLVFAYAKPQPLNPFSLRRQDQQTTIIALAGPVANVVLAFAFGGLFRALGSSDVHIARFLADCLIVNVTLAAMNLMPIPPLDMARVVARFLPPRPREVLTNLEQYGALFMLLIFFIISGPIFDFVRAIANGICQAAAGGLCL
jgi:Zn-dependent protease